MMMMLMKAQYIDGRNWILLLWWCHFLLLSQIPIELMIPRCAPFPEPNVYQHCHHHPVPVWFSAVRFVHISLQACKRNQIVPTTTTTATAAVDQPQRKVLYYSARHVHPTQPDRFWLFNFNSGVGGGDGGGINNNKNSYSPPPRAPSL